MKFFVCIILIPLNILVFNSSSYAGLLFNGTDDSIKISKYIANGREALSVSLWVKGMRAGNILTSQSVILHFYDSFGFHLKASDGSGSGYVYWNKGIASCGRWQHIAATWSNKKTGDGKMRLYVNGTEQFPELEFCAGGKGTLGGGIIIVGGRFNPWISNFKGQMEDLRIYNRALSHGEILSIFVRRGQDEINSGLILRWPMNSLESISGNKILDMSGNGNYGIMSKNQILMESEITKDKYLNTDITLTLDSLKQDKEKARRMIEDLNKLFLEYPSQTLEFKSEFNELKQRYADQEKEEFSPMRGIYRDSLMLEAKIGFKILNIN